MNSICQNWSAPNKKFKMDSKRVPTRLRSNMAHVCHHLTWRYALGEVTCQEMYLAPMLAVI